MSVVSRLSDWPRAETRRRAPQDPMGPGHSAEIHILPCIRRERTFDPLAREQMDVAQSA